MTTGKILPVLAAAGIGCAIGAGLGSAGYAIDVALSAKNLNWGHAAVATGAGCAFGAVVPIAATLAAGTAASAMAAAAAGVAPAVALTVVSTAATEGLIAVAALSAAIGGARYIADSLLDSRPLNLKDYAANAIWGGLKLAFAPFHHLDWILERGWNALSSPNFANGRISTTGNLK